MADYKNQHFVPQYFFKNFSGSHRCINLLVKETGAIIHKAPIKNQCSRSYFYGSTENENNISEIETQIKIILNDLLKIKTDEDFKNVYALPYFTKLYFAILFQEFRTERNALQSKLSADELMIECFKNYLTNSSEVPENVKNNIDKLNNANMEIKCPLAYYLAIQFKSLTNSTHYLVDLGIHILKNKTSEPFIFCDSPVIFYNQYYRNVKKRGVIGLSTPGLMIFYPLSPDTIVLLIDDTIYKCPWGNDDGVYEIKNKYDVKHINKLQLHNALKTVYFPDSMPDKTILKYWKQEKRNFKNIQSGVSKKSMYVDGVLKDNVIHNMQSQLPYILKLSFIKSDVLDDSQYHFRRRWPEIHELVKELDKCDNSEEAFRRWERKFSDVYKNQ
jgi:hypothetical protein